MHWAPWLSRRPHCLSLSPDPPPRCKRLRKSDTLIPGLQSPAQRSGTPCLGCICPRAWYLPRAVLNPKHTSCTLGLQAHVCENSSHFPYHTLERQGSGQVWLHPEHTVARLVWKGQLLLWGRGDQLQLWSGRPWAGLPQPSEDKDLGPLAFHPALPCGWRRATHPSRAKV